MRAGFAVERLLPLACLGGAILLGVSQFVTMFELNDALGGTQRVVEGLDQHWYSMVILSVFSIFALLAAVATGSRPLATSVAVAGGVAVLLFLLIDLPDAGKAGDIESVSESLVIVEADPAGGFWLELIGALILAACGGALAALTPDQLRSLRPGGGGAGGPAKRTRLRSQPPWRRPGADAEPTKAKARTGALSAEKRSAKARYQR